MGDYDQTIDRTGADALIPEEVANTIIKQLPTKSAALSLMRKVPMSRKQNRLPVLSAKPVAYWVNGDQGLKKTSTQEWEGKNLIAEELAVIVPVPEAVLDDADFPIWPEVQEGLIEAMGQAVDLATLFGVNKPASWPAAIVPAAVAAGNVFVQGSADQDISVDIEGEDGVMSLVETDGFDVTGFAAHKRLKGALRGLRDDNGQPIYQRKIGEDPATLSSEPLFFSENGGWVDDDARLIAGDWSKAVLGIRQDITFKILDQSVISDEEGAVILNFAQQDSVGMRAVFRVAYTKANPVTRLNDDANTRDPFAVLQPEGSS